MESSLIADVTQNDLGSLVVSQKAKQLPYNLVIPLLGVYPKDSKAVTQSYMHVNSTMRNRWGNSGNSVRLFWGAPKSLQMVIAAMKLRHLLLGRKVMTNLDSILKSRDITLPTKVRLVKTMVFPVVMYGCER